MTKERIEKAIEVINYAIKNQISVKEASVKCGYADTYVKNIKALVYDKYENGTLDDELFTIFDDAYKTYNAHKVFGIKSDDEVDSDDSPRNESPLLRGDKLTQSVKDGVTDIEWVSGSNYPPNHIKTLEELLKEANINLDFWKVKDYIINKWDVTSTKTKEPITIQNFQVKARFEEIVQNVGYKHGADIFIDMVKNYVPPKLNITPRETNYIDNNLLEISIFDLHLGKLAWAGETGENYDTKIARERFIYSINDLLKKASGFNYSRILFPVGNDFFNSDTIFNTTTKGTQQDEDLRWQKTYDLGVLLMVDAVNLLKQTGVPIEVLVIQGNHDFERSYYMGKYLEAWFHNDSMVNVNNGASPRKYVKFGKVLLGFTHGSEEKESSLPMLMANDIESKPLWSDTTFHEWHLGHQHRKKNVRYIVLDKERMLNEDLGVTIRYLSSLTGTEEWHHKKGFVGQIKAADGFIWNDTHGFCAHLNSNYIIKE